MTLTPGFTYAEFNNLQAFKDAYVPGKTCAIMFEPVQGARAAWPADEDFIKGIRAFCDEGHPDAAGRGPGWLGAVAATSCAT
ncbi:MAG: hypothetical protein ACLUNZ_08040 [Evtepia sp.]